MFWFVLGQAQAQEARWVVEYGSDPSHTRVATCKADEEALLGTALVSDVMGPVAALQGTGAVPGGWEAAADWLPGFDLGFELTDMGMVAGALCVSDKAESCAREQTTVIQPGPYGSMGAFAQCPDGTFLLGGGARLTGDAEGVAFQSLAGTGMFAFDAMQAKAEYIADGAPGAWGLEVTAVCVPPDVLEGLTLHTLAVRWAGGGAFDTWGPGVTGPYTFTGTYMDADPKVCQLPIFLSTNGAGDHYVAGTGWAAAWGGGFFTGEWFQGYHAYWSESVCGGAGAWDPQHGCPDAPYSDQLLCGVPEDLERSLLECGGGPPRAIVDRFAIGARVVFGVADGSDGFVWVPGEGPVPVDPQPFREAFAATPVAVTTYADARARDTWIAQVGAVLNEEGTRWRRVDDLSKVDYTDEMLIVTPSDELAAVDWLARHRDRLDANRAPVVLFLERDGKAVDRLHAW